MYNVLDVARYVINYGNSKDYIISNLKLQKLLYFIQAYFLMNDRGQCFYEAIEANDIGPIVPVAYDEFKLDACGHIPPITSYLVRDSKDVWNPTRVKYDDSLIDDDDKILINTIVDEFSEYSSTDLVELTQSQRPWKEIFAKNPNGEIPLELIKEYFFNEKQSDKKANVAYWDSIDNIIYDAIMKVAEKSEKPVNEEQFDMYITNITSAVREIIIKELELIGCVFPYVDEEL